MTVQPFDGRSLRFGVVVMAGMIVMIVVVCMIVTVPMVVIAAGAMLVFAGRLFRRERRARRDGIAEAGDLAADRLQIARDIVLHAHGAGGDGNGNIRNPRHAAYRRIDLAGTGGAIHALHPEPRLFHIGHRIILFSLSRMFYDL